MATQTQEQTTASNGNGNGNGYSNGNGNKLEMLNSGAQIEFSAGATLSFTEYSRELDNGKREKRYLCRLAGAEKCLIIGNRSAGGFWAGVGETSTQDKIRI